MSTIISNGGGATHIAKRTGQLKDLSSYTSDILIVSGGGGGGLLVDETDYLGKDAGGISGSGDNSADQTTGNAFGLGENGTDVSGGGSGLYGGYKGTSSKSGGAGSGYIGNPLLSNKKMVGYNVPTSSAEGTKTESVNTYESTHTAYKPKSGNGWARIKKLGELKEYNLWDIVSNSDVANATNCGGGPTQAQLDSNNVLWYGQSGKTKPPLENGIIHFQSADEYAATYLSFPLNKTYKIIGLGYSADFTKTSQVHIEEWTYTLMSHQTQSSYASVHDGVWIVYTNVDQREFYDNQLKIYGTGSYSYETLYNKPILNNRIMIVLSYGKWDLYNFKVKVIE